MDHKLFRQRGADQVLQRLGSALACVLLLNLAISAPAHEDDSLLDRLATIEEDFGSVSAPSDPTIDLRARIVEIAKGLPPSADPSGQPSARVQALNHLIFGQLEIRASQEMKDPDNLLPSRVLERKQGYCVGIAALYLALSEHLDLPIYAVATPSHVFLRYDDGTTRINIETLQGGANIPDEHYIREQKTPEKSIRRGTFMRNLTTDEFLAQVHNNLGVIYSERKEYDAAAKEYETALDLDPHLPAAHYNYGNDSLRQGAYRRAVRRFSKSLRLYPTDVWALNNRGLAYLKLSETFKARRDFEEALKIDPGFEQATRNLEGMQSPR